MNKIVLKGYIEVPEDKVDVVKEELTHHIKKTRAEDGCIAFEVVQDTENNLKFTVYEEFTDKEAFDKHQERAKESDWGKLTRDYKREYEIKEI